MNYIPREVDCDSQTVNRCDWYNHKDCQHTCNLAGDYDMLGIGAMTEMPGSLEKEIEDEK